MYLLIQKWSALFVGWHNYVSWLLTVMHFFSAMSWISLRQMVWPVDGWKGTSGCWWPGLISEMRGYEAVELVLFQSGQVPGVSPLHLSTPLFLLVLLLHSTKGLIFCMIRPPPVLLLAPGPRLGSNTPSINMSKFLAESHQNETEKSGRMKLKYDVERLVGEQCIHLVIRTALFVSFY